MTVLRNKQQHQGEQQRESRSTSPPARIEVTGHLWPLCPKANKKAPQVRGACSFMNRCLLKKRKPASPQTLAHD